MRALAGVLLLALGFASAQPIAPGADLSERLGVQSGDRRWGLDGLPPGPAGVIPQAPATPGQHWLVEYDAGAAPIAWHRLDVIGDPSPDAIRILRLDIDAEPPSASIVLEPSLRANDGTLIVGPEAQIEIEASDPSGGVEVSVLIDGLPLGSGAHWSEGRRDGSYRLSLRVRDALGNEGERAVTDVILDRTPPSVDWRRLDAADAVPADVFNGKRARLAILAVDAAAGLDTLILGETMYDAALLDAGPVEVSVNADSLDYVARDRVGNARQGTIALRADTEGPRFVASRNGEPVELDGAVLQRTDRLQLAADDPLAGVARACVEASIWYGACRELPVDLVGIAPGRYLLEFRAADQLGNRSYRRISMQVLP